MKNSPTANFALSEIAPLFNRATRRELQHAARRGAKFGDLHQTARDYRNRGFEIRESVELAAEHHEPYQNGLPFWNHGNMYAADTEYKMARHFIPGTPWRGGNRWQH